MVWDCAAGLGLSWAEISLSFFPLSSTSERETQGSSLCRKLERDCGIWIWNSWRFRFRHLVHCAHKATDFCGSDRGREGERDGEASEFENGAPFLSLFRIAFVFVPVFFFSSRRKEWDEIFLNSNYLARIRQGRINGPAAKHQVSEAYAGRSGERERERERRERCSVSQAQEPGNSRFLMWSFFSLVFFSLSKAQVICSRQVRRKWAGQI